MLMSLQLLWDRIMSLEIRRVRVSGSVYGNFHCSWTISKFSELDYVVGKKIESEYFQCQENSTRWNLCIYPGGDIDKRNGSVGCFLRLHPLDNNGNEFIEVSSFSFRDTDDNVLWESKSFNWDVLIPGAEWGYNRPIQRNTLIKKLNDDVLIIIVNVKYCRTFVKDRENTEYTAEMSPIIQLVDNFQSLYNRAWGLSRKRTDCVLCAGSEKIPVHSAVLSARSKVFKTMFENDMKNRKIHQVEITDLNKDIMNLFIEFVYTGNVKVMSINVSLELLGASDKYEMKDLKLFCSNYLIAHLDDENVGEILVKGHNYKASKLKTKSMDYLCARCDRQILEKHRPMLKNYPELLFDILGVYADYISKV